MLNIAVTGHGNWGKNLARNFNALPDATLRYVCDADASQRDNVKSLYPETTVTDDYSQLLGDASLDAIVIATGAPLHFELAKKSLTAGKHTFVEKPLTLSSAESLELCQLAEKNNKKLMVGHLLEYHPAVELLQQSVNAGELGEICYLYCERLNLGIVRNHENAWWSLAPHDISVACFLLGDTPEAITATGQSYLQKGVEDVVFATLQFPGNRLANIHVSWLDPNKTRRVTLVGNEKMAIFDDGLAEDKVRIFESAAKKEEATGLFKAHHGETLAAELDAGEPLRKECQHFLDAIEQNFTPRSDGLDGHRVVQVLEAGQKSIEAGGELVRLR